jgi:cysteine-rich repeat protein
MSVRHAVAAFAILAALFTSAHADTTVPGGNVINQTWSPAGSPYIVQGDIIVPSGASLTIEAGTVVQFAASDGQAAGTDPGRVELIVRGTLTVNGTVVSPVSLRGVSTSPGSWYGVVIDTTAAAATLNNLTVTHAVRGVSYQATAATVSSSGVTVQSASSFGLYVAAGAPTFSGFSAIGGSSSGVYIDSAGSLTLTNCVVRDNVGQGIYFAPSTAGRALSVANCSINANGNYGIRSAGSPGTVTVTNSIVTNHTSVGVYRNDSSSFSISYSNVWNNPSNLSGTITSSNLLSANPLYVSSTNLRLTSNSPSRFGAMGGGDQGALPYTSDATPGLYGTLWTNTSLTTAGSPYAIGGDLTVGPGVTLSIAPGVTLSFAATDIMAAGTDPGRAELLVDGRLTAAGTAANPITLRGASASPGSWYGLQLRTTAAASLVEHVTIVNAVRGLSLFATAANTLNNITAQSSSSFGLYVGAGAPTADGFSAIGGSSSGVYIDSAGSLTLTNCVVRDNVGQGIYFAPSTAGRTLSVANCSINANGNYGIRSAGSPGTVTVTNSIITNHTSVGVYRNDSSSFSISYSNVWNNPSNLSGTITSSNLLSANPLYVSSTNLRLTSNSPSRFGAMGGGDQGALPYTSDATPGLYGTLWTNTSLTTAGSPYAVGGDLTVGPGVTLSIAPGVTLSFAAADIMAAGTDPGRAELLVDGRLTAAGTAANPITLSGASVSPGSWYGLQLRTSAAASLVEHVTIVNAVRGLSLFATAANTLNNITAQSSSSFGLYVGAGTPTADGFAAIGSSGTGVYVDGPASLTLTNCLLRDNLSQGIYFAPSTAGRTLSVANCSINANGNYGIRSAGSNGSITITNSIITNHTSVGVYRPDSSTFSISYSNVWNNPTNVWSGITSSNLLSANPLYVSSTNLRLQSTSVCIDAGTATGAPTRDILGTTRPLDGDGINGNQFDMGTYEFVRVVVCGNGSLEPGEVCDDGPSNGMYGFCNTGCSGLGPRCGDSAVNGPEQCDDGNASNTDACLTTCRTATCGDNFIQAGVEQCDDGNTIATDACTATCQTARCGDNVVRAGLEQCDDGNTSDTDGCVGACQIATCGDGFLQSGVEACDDGNTLSTDACTASCVAATCGDGFVQAGVEQCDDMNSSNTDACVGACQSARCGDGFLRAGVEACDDGNLIDTDACSNSCTAPSCGDGVVQAGEECDDNNTIDTDGCRTNCMAARCGDGVIRTGVEMCDDGNTVNTDACTATCVPATCGDGILHIGSEECDDANADNADACVAGCVAARCGDTYVRTGVEACDDGNTNNADGCTNACALSSCGDGVVQAGEECDDANQVETDACRNTCLSARCGDLVVQTGVEMCDDGNTMSGDGCSASCSVESTIDAGVDAPVGADAGGDGGGGGGGCCQTGAGGREGAALGALAVLLGLRRRRRR